MDFLWVGFAAVGAVTMLAFLGSERQRQSQLHENAARKAAAGQAAKAETPTPPVESV